MPRPVVSIIVGVAVGAAVILATMSMTAAHDGSVSAQADVRSESTKVVPRIAKEVCLPDFAELGWQATTAGDASDASEAVLLRKGLTLQVQDPKVYRAISYPNASNLVENFTALSHLCNRGFVGAGG